MVATGQEMVRGKKFFKVREMSGNFILGQGKLAFWRKVREKWNCKTDLIPSKVGRNISGQMGVKDCCNRRLEAATISEILHKFGEGNLTFIREKSRKSQGILKTDVCGNHVISFSCRTVSLKGSSLFTNFTLTWLFRNLLFRTCFRFPCVFETTGFDCSPNSPYGQLVNDPSLGPAEPKSHNINYPSISYEQLVITKRSRGPRDTIFVNMHPGFSPSRRCIKVIVSYF